MINGCRASECHPWEAMLAYIICVCLCVCALRTTTTDTTKAATTISIWDGNRACSNHYHSTTWAQTEFNDFVNADIIIICHLRIDVIWIKHTQYTYYCLLMLLFFSVLKFWIICFVGLFFSGLCGQFNSKFSSGSTRAGSQYWKYTAHAFKLIELYCHWDRQTLGNLCLFACPKCSNDFALMIKMMLASLRR